MATVNSILSSIDLKDEKQLVNLVSTLWGIRRYHKYNLEKEWFRNIAWYAGYQNLIWNRISNNLEEPPADEWRVRLVVNKLQAHIRTLLAKYYKGRSEWDVIPATADTLDIAISQIDKQVLEYRWQQQNMAENWIEIINWLVTTGNCFAKVCWDAEAGDPLLINPSDFLEEYYLDKEAEKAAITKVKQQLSRDKTLIKEKDKYKLFLGDTVLKVKSPFDIIIDPLCTNDLDNAAWLLDSSLMSPFEIKNKFDVDVSTDTPIRGVAEFFNFSRRLSRLSNSGFNLTSEPSGYENSVLLHELWIKPTNRGKFKDGRHIIVAGTKILKNEPLSYNHRKIPYVHFGEIRVPGRFWYTSTLEQILPIQADYNKARSQIIEARNLMSKPKYTMPKGAGVANNAINDQPGEVIEYNYPYKPERLEPPNLPSYVIQNIEITNRDMEDVSGIHDVAQAEAPGQVRGTGGILALIEQDEGKITPNIIHLNERLARLGKLVLATDAQYVKEDRIARIIGSDDEILMFTWSGQQLTGKNYGRPGIDYFDVRVKTITGMPSSPVAQAALVDNLIKAGAINGQEDKELIFRLLNIGSVQKILDKSRTHRSKAFTENLEMLQGKQVPVFTWQDHNAHLEVLNEYRNSIEYQNLDENIKQLFTIHEQAHKQARALVEVEPEVLRQQAAQQLVIANGVIPNGPQEQQGTVQAEAQGR